MNIHGNGPNILENNDNGTNNRMNNLTARDHLFQAMFSRIALTYDRTFPPFARRFIEFMLLLTAISVLFILIYIHMAFVKAPITCLDHFTAFNGNLASSDMNTHFPGEALKHMVIRVEVLRNSPVKYGLMNSYKKEYDDYNRLDKTDTSDSFAILSSENYNQKSMFLNILQNRCPINSTIKEFVHNKVNENDPHINIKKEKENLSQQQPDGFLYKLFNFPINPILQKAEYWREKLSVRAMAPFRHTFNELELFTKSVFTEEKYIMEYSLEYGLLRLTPQTRERLKIPVHFVLLDANKDKCFGNALSRFLLQEFVGYDQIIIGSMKRLAERQNGKGYVRNVVSGEHYRFVNSWMSRTSYLAAGFIMIIFTLSVSMLLRYSHHQIFVFIVDLLRMLENNLQFSFPAAPLLTVVLALVGMEAIMSEFFNDTSTAFYTILIIWIADQYEAVCCRTYISKRHWPKYFYLYHFAFYSYHYRFNGQFSGLALLCSWLFIQHSMFFFFHHYELPRLMHGIAVRVIMDSLIVERTENTSLTPTNSTFPNDDDNDRSNGDRRDNDEDPGPSDMQSISPSGENVGRKEHNNNFRHTESQEETQYSHESSQSSDNHALILFCPISMGETKKKNDNLWIIEFMKIDYHFNLKILKEELTKFSIHQFDTDIKTIDSMSLYIVLIIIRFICFLFNHSIIINIIFVIIFLHENQLRFSLYSFLKNSISKMARHNHHNNSFYSIDFIDKNHHLTLYSLKSSTVYEQFTVNHQIWNNKWKNDQRICFDFIVGKSVIFSFCSLIESSFARNYIFGFPIRQKFLEQFYSSLLNVNLPDQSFSFPEPQSQNCYIHSVDHATLNVIILIYYHYTISTIQTINSFKYLLNQYLKQLISVNHSNFVHLYSIPLTFDLCSENTCTNQFRSYFITFCCHYDL